VEEFENYVYYNRMKPTATTGFIALSMETPGAEIADFDRIVEQYRGRILRFVFVSVRDMDLAETLTQDCLWKAYKNRHTFRGDSSVHTWLIRIAMNLIRDSARNRRLQFWKKAWRVDTEVIRNQPHTGMSPEQRAAMNQQVEAVWEATATLSERQRTVFLLRYVEDLNICEIAQLTGLTESTVNVHLARAVQGIRKKLGK
jgi:RNA polymerase sigma-70 factor (ECF subfamily)